MKKYLIVLLITIIVIISILKISAFSDECIVVDTPYASSLIQISRCDCVCFIMLAIGAQSTTYSTTEQKVICEYETDIVGEEKADLAEKYISRCMFQKKRDLVHQAARYLGIINGEYRVGENERYIFFNTYRTVRLDECLAFIVRCLEEDKAVKKSLEETFEMAKDYGLILESDYFYDCPNKELMLSDLRIILERFIDMPMGWHRIGMEYYYGKYFDFEYDGISGKTYREYLSSYFTDAFIEKLLSYDGSVQWDPEERYEFLAIQEN